MNPKYNIPDTEKYFIIGRKIEDKAEELGISEKIGEEETLIEIPKGIIDEKQSSSKTKSEEKTNQNEKE